jgi:hypothetical protein
VLAGRKQAPGWLDETKCEKKETDRKHKFHREIMPCDNMLRHTFTSLSLEKLLVSATFDDRHNRPSFRAQFPSSQCSPIELFTLERTEVQKKIPTGFWEFNFSSLSEN